MLKNKLNIDLRFTILLIPLLILELIFHYIQFASFDLIIIFRIYLFIFIFSIFVDTILSLFDLKTYFIIVFIILLVLCSYSFVELIFKNFMNDFYSFNTVSDGALRIAQYVKLFLSNAKISYYLCFFPLLIFALIFILINKQIKHNIGINLVMMLISLMMFYMSLNMGSYHNVVKETYISFTNKTLIINHFGINNFLLRDIISFFYTPEQEVIIETVDQQEIIYTDYSRTIDDSLWSQLSQQETNNNIKTIDKYLMNKNIADKNDMTGIYEGYNFIYSMVEAFDYLAIDKDLTPTLYHMYNNGNTFYNHYSPLYSCATGESEYVSYVSLFPYLNYCTPNYVHRNNYYEALAYLFKDKGYSTFALHNWRDEFYERKTFLNNVGFDYYIDIDDIWKDTSIRHTDGWQSDSMLVMQAIKQIENTQGNFFCDIITSVMHFPYDQSSYWGDHYLSEVRKIHPDWPIEYQRYMSKSMDFDNGLSILLEYLENNNLIDNTIICIYADHRPYWLDYDLLTSYTSHLNDRSFEYGVYRSPFIIYQNGSEGVVNYNYCSTLDHVPTIANLFNLNYDPRLYMGEDAYSKSNTVIFADGNWLNKDGIYHAINNSFVTYDNSSYDENEIDKINNNVKNIIKISSLIFDEAYFEKRKDICIVDN